MNDTADRELFELAMGRIKDVMETYDIVFDDGGNCEYGIYFIKGDYQANPEHWIPVGCKPGRLKDL